MDRIEGIVYMLDQALNTKRKRHIAGGVLMSISAFTFSLALTIMTIKTEELYEKYID